MILIHLSILSQIALIKAYQGSLTRNPNYHDGGSDREMRQSYGDRESQISGVLEGQPQLSTLPALATSAFIFQGEFLLIIYSD